MNTAGKILKLTEIETSFVVTKNMKIIFFTDSTYEERVQNALP